MPGILVCSQVTALEVFSMAQVWVLVAPGPCRLWRGLWGPPKGPWCQTALPAWDRGLLCDFPAAVGEGERGGQVPSEGGDS